jgi:hypothetical protein
MAELLLGHRQVLEEAQAGAKKRRLATAGMQQYCRPAQRWCRQWMNDEWHWAPVEEDGCSGGSGPEGSDCTRRRLPGARSAMAAGFRRTRAPWLGLRRKVEWSPDNAGRSGRPVLSRRALDDARCRPAQRMGAERKQW